MSDRYVVIIAGGTGERFWPQSRAHKPKHFLPIVGDGPMLTQTVERLSGLITEDNILVITNEAQLDGVMAICPQLNASQVVGEPEGRDTAAAVLLALALVKSKNPQAVFAVLPADHVITDHDAFTKDLETAFVIAENNDVLVTVGVNPTHPATGYGYIHSGEQLNPDTRALKVNRFVEKPDLETAKDYLSSGSYLWNAGMFVWSVASLEKAFSEHASELFQYYSIFCNMPEKKDARAAILKEHYSKLEKISVDYALMEKAKNVVTLPASFGWDDVGEWPAVGRHYKADSNGNVSKGECQLQDSSNNIVMGQDGHLIALVGVEGLIVVSTPDATLVCRKDKAQDVKRLVKAMAQNPKQKVFI